jgi:hypothetical protein
VPEEIEENHKKASGRIALIYWLRFKGITF